GTGQHYFALTDDTPIEGVIRPKWRELMIEQDDHGNKRVNRIITKLMPFKPYGKSYDVRKSGSLEQIAIVTMMKISRRILKNGDKKIMSLLNNLWIRKLQSKN